MNYDLYVCTIDYVYAHSNSDKLIDANHLHLSVYDKCCLHYQSLSLFLDYCTSYGLSTTNHPHYFVLSHPWLYVLDTQGKREEELSNVHDLVVSWITWCGRLPGKPGKPKHVVRVNKEILA